MTPLTKPVSRQLDVIWRRQHLQARIAPEGLYLKGRKQRWSSAYLLPWAAAYDTAVKMRVQEERREKAAARKARRAA